MSISIPLASTPRVLIVGAGPTGLTLALALARYGISVRIIEKKQHLSRSTKATNLMQRNQEVLYALGLLDTYEQERLTLRKALQNAQYNSLKYTTLVTPRWMQAVMRGIAEPLLNHGGEYRMAQAFSQLAINTRSSPLTLDLAGKRGLRAGDRAWTRTSFKTRARRNFTAISTRADGRCWPLQEQSSLAPPKMPPQTP